MDTRAINKGQFVEIDGLDQWVVIRGKEPGNPVMLVISGPGMALSTIAPFFESWEHDYTLVHWDQPGAGATFGATPEGQGPLSIDRLVKNAISVVEYVRTQLDVEKLIVLGISAGSIVGLQMMQRRPGYFSAFVGTGQFVNWAEQDALSYDLLLEKARSEGDKEAQRELLDIGEPPYEDSSADEVKSRYHSALTEAETEVLPVFFRLTQEALTNPPPGADYLARNVTLENPRTLAAAAYEEIRPDLLAFDAWSMPMKFAMPLFFFQGDQDYYSVTSSVRAYENEISAPVRKTVIIKGGSHSVIWLREKFLQELNRNVRPVAINQVTTHGL